MTIPLAAVDPADQTYRISRAGDDTSALALSVSLLGMTSSPAVIEKTSDTHPEHQFAVVSGFRRFEAARSLGMDPITCRVYKSGEDETCARVAVSENAFSRELSLGEVVRAAVLLSRHMDTAALADQSLALFNTRLNRNYLDTLIKVSSLGPLVPELMDSGRLAVKGARALAQMPPEDAQHFISLFTAVKASSAKQTDIITWAKEICAREKIRLKTLFSEDDIKDALDPHSGHPDAAAAANRIRARLYTRRYPELTTARNKAASLVRDLKLPSDIRITLPENFESCTYTVTVSIDSPEDLASCAAALSDLAGHPALQRLLDR